MNQSQTITANFTARPALRDNTPLEGLIDQGFRLTLIGVQGGQYEVQNSSDLGTWTPLGTVTVTNDYGEAQFVDVNGTNEPLGLYRLLQIGP